MGLSELLEDEINKEIYLDKSKRTLTQTKMSKPKYTPGPWMNPAMSNEVMTVPIGEIKICKVFPVSEENNGAANARLIAAAPDLYKALSDYVNYGDSKIARDAALKALKKARTL